MNKTLGVLVSAAFLIGLCAAGPSKAEPGAPAAGPSFGCAAPSRVEQIICGDAALSAADRRMAALYQAAKAGTLNSGSNQLAAQRQWLKDRDTQCAAAAWKQLGLPSAHDCVAGAYKDRLRALAVADLLATPELSLAELRAVAPKAEPYYEALLAYATIDDPAQRAKAVEARLAPLYAGMSREVRQGLDYVGKDATTAHGAASSDAGFAQLFDVASMEDNLDLIWPCAALIRRPGLVAGLGSIWGGAIDSSVPSSDCEDALPSPPELSTLSKAAFAVQPPCEGTIRFSTGREYAMLEDAVRLRRRDVWQGKGGDISPDEASFLHRHAALVGRT